jgi:hypothetical protein
MDDDGPKLADCRHCGDAPKMTSKPFVTHTMECQGCGDSTTGKTAQDAVKAWNEAHGYFLQPCPQCQCGAIAIIGNERMEIQYRVECMNCQRRVYATLDKWDAQEAINLWNAQGKQYE